MEEVLQSDRSTCYINAAVKKTKHRPDEGDEDDRKGEEWLVVLDQAKAGSRACVCVRVHACVSACVRVL